MKYVFVILAFVVVFGLGYYFSPPGMFIPSWEEHDQKLVQLEKELSIYAMQIQESAGQGMCRDSYQCKIVGLGAKTCDHYTSYLLYSVADVYEAHILDLVGKFNSLSEEMAKNSLKVGSCGTPPKVAQCVDSKCVVIDK